MVTIKKDLNDTQYHEIPFLSASKLKSFIRSPKEYLYFHGNDLCSEIEKPEQKETTSLILGRAIHCAVLEPEEFSKRFLKSVFKTDRKAHEKMKKDYPEATILSEKDFDMIIEIAKSIFNHDVAKKLLADIIPELALIDEKRRYKAKLDAVVSLRNGENLIIDLKTCASLPRNAFGFSKIIEDYGYDIQYAFYTMMAEETGEIDPKHWRFIFVEKNPPYEIAIVNPIGYKDVATEKIKTALNQYEELTSHGSDRDSLERNFNQGRHPGTLIVEPSRYYGGEDND